MTETDNPDVKKHLQPDRDHSDEFLATIETLDDNERTNRNMYAMRSIQPGVVIGHYNPVTKKYALGPFHSYPTVPVHDVVSQAVYTFTAPYRCEIIYFSARNDTRAFGSTLTYKGVVIVDGVMTAFTQAREHPLIGGLSNIDDVVIEGLPPLTLETGETLVHTDATFVAADVTERIIIYRRVN